MLNKKKDNFLASKALGLSLVIKIAEYRGKKDPMEIDGQVYQTCFPFHFGTQPDYIP